MGITGEGEEEEGNQFETKVFYFFFPILLFFSSFFWGGDSKFFLSLSLDSVSYSLLPSFLFSLLFSPFFFLFLL